MAHQVTSQNAELPRWAISEISGLAKQTISQIPVKNPMRKSVASVFKQALADIGQLTVAGLTRQDLSCILQVAMARLKCIALTQQAIEDIQNAVTSVKKNRKSHGS